MVLLFLQTGSPITLLLYISLFLAGMGGLPWLHIVCLVLTRVFCYSHRMWPVLFTQKQNGQSAGLKLWSSTLLSCDIQDVRTYHLSSDGSFCPNMHQWISVLFLSLSWGPIKYCIPLLNDSATMLPQLVHIWIPWLSVDSFVSLAF